MTDNLRYNKNLKTRANELRNSMTKAEACLWKYILKGKQLKGYQFRRQRPILNFIADFLCKDLKLIIEVDGITHHFEENFKKDIVREEELRQAGFCVVRFKDEDILRNIDGVRSRLEEVIDEIVLLRQTPSATSSKGG